ncbi:MAG TPA: hypothetical protein VG225_13960 [Terracidiphilus sp.]|jgi:hypothetical protein|nr:hypothetical protein [Terracidiphilus sp.]
MKRTLLAGLLLAIATPMFATNYTGQGISVTMTGGGDYVITQNLVYKFNFTTASGFFTNAWDGNAPTVSCSGGKCGVTPTPAAPGAPLADASKVSGTQPGSACETNECTFFSGGTLTGLTYTQTAKVTPVSGAIFTFTYTYVVTPTTSSVDPLTAWDLVQSSGDDAVVVPISATIAGESVVVNSTFKCVSGVPGTAKCGKFSFNLGTPGYNLADNRVSGLVVTVTNASSVVVFSQGAYSTVEDGVPYGTLTFPYTTNAGSNGATAYLQSGDAYTIMQSNDVPGGGFGPADLEEAVMDTVSPSLGPGSYTVTLTGTVKGNSASASILFSVSQQLHISAGDCTPPAN